MGQVVFELLQKNRKIDLGVKATTIFNFLVKVVTTNDNPVKLEGVMHLNKSR
jgi:hypothetical protein